MKSVIQIVLAASVLSTLVACQPKKTTSFSAKYAKNALGAAVVDGRGTQAADEAAIAQGVEANVTQLVRSNNQVGGVTITSVLSINKTSQQTITTNHSSSEVIEGCVDLAGKGVVVRALCLGSNCASYYLATEVYSLNCSAITSNPGSAFNSLVIQQGVKKSFVNAAEDRYQWFTKESSLPFIGADSFDVRSVVGFLNSAQ